MHKPSKHAARNDLICRAVAEGATLHGVGAQYAISGPAVRQMIKAWWKKNAKSRRWPHEHIRVTRTMAKDLAGL